MLFSSGPVSWLVVFLGNPGLRYEGTRHNAGFMAADAFSQKHDVRISRVARFYKIPPEHILVLSDDITLPIGALRIRTKGSSGGHNGLKNIIEVLGTDAFPRIRIGVGSPPHPDYDTIDWVLSVFRDQDAEDMAEAASRAADAAECYIAEGPEKAMNRYSQKKVK